MLGLLGIFVGAARAQSAAEWVERFRFQPIFVAPHGVAAPIGSEQPSFTVTPAEVGQQLVRVSIPFPRGTFPAELGLVVQADSEKETVLPDVRVLTLHPGRPVSVRRALVTFPFSFAERRPYRFTLRLTDENPNLPAIEEKSLPFQGRLGDLQLRVETDRIRVDHPALGRWEATLVAPDRSDATKALLEVVEAGRHFLWLRILLPDSEWPRILEVRADALGTVAFRGHLQRLLDEEERAPTFGWRLVGPAGSLPTPPEHAFATGEPFQILGNALRVAFPDAHLKRRGSVSVRENESDLEVLYLRCRAEERVPHQQTAWRSATVVLSLNSSAPWTELLEPSHTVRVGPEWYDALYQSGLPLDLRPWPLLEDAWQGHLDLIAGSSALGDDFGNVTSMPRSGVFGMNRLNHNPPIFAGYYRTGDARLRIVALRWCDNFYNLSVWWGLSPDPEQFGGTRYNNAGLSEPRYAADPSFMWRSNSAVHFTTKGFDSFFYAFEETGDPRMAVALRWQVEYAKKRVHAGPSGTRNIGIVDDFVRLYQFTGQQAYLNEALRLFRELRETLSTGDLFTESGRPIDPNPPFIDDDQTGYQHPFAKPYILGYALSGLPWLAGYYPEEPKLRDVVRAVADFQAAAQDPVGGWRYPHPRSSRVFVGQGIEHAAQLARAAAFLAAQGEPIDNLLDAIERTLQSRLLVWERTGALFSALGGWEKAAGILQEGQTLADLYARPEDRDPSRDYAEGALSIGGGAPESVVYFFELLDFYLRHRPADRLFTPNDALQQVLERIPWAEGRRPPDPSPDYAGYGMAEQLPIFTPQRIQEMVYPRAFDPNGMQDFSAWRAEARQFLIASMLTPPPRAAFQPVLLATEDRGSYEARKLVFSISRWERIPAYLLVPKGRGPFPAIVALHDHGGHFFIGKEKVVRPFDVSQEVRDDAEAWVRRSYGGRHIGDELAARDYVVLAIDALFWGERGRKEGPDPTRQQELAANLFQLGMTWNGVISWDDLRCVEFLSALPEVDPSRIGAIGLSMGAHRTWTLAAMTDRVRVGAAICWMGTTDSLMVPGNNQVRGQSAFAFILPDVRNGLDYPDVAAIAAPKPMLFFNGEEDALFPVPGVQKAYARMRRVWESQGAGEHLVTKLWPVPHVFNREMQREAFAFLDRYLSPDR